MRTVLPIPIDAGTTRYVAALYRAPSAGVLADAAKAVDQGQRFGAFQILVQGIVDGFEDDAGETLEERSGVRAVVKLMPYRSAEVVAMKSLVSIAEDDGIPGYYTCPRCGREMICDQEIDPEDGSVISDTRDFLEQLPMKEVANGSVDTVELRDPIELKLKTQEGDVTETITSLAIHQPTLRDCIAAERRSPGNDSVRLQLAVYVESTEQMNGDPVDNRWRNAVGRPIYERMSARDMRRMGEVVDRYGLDTTVVKTCGNCGKVWKVTVNLSSFFGSALSVGIGVV